jgi:hypothetical protein
LAFNEIHEGAALSAVVGNIMLEAYGLWLLVAGVLLGGIGYFWLVAVAFKQRVLWGLALLILPPVALFFIARHFRQVRRPLLIMLLGAIVFTTPYGMSYYAEHFVKLGPHERWVDGELRITLTGLKDVDYAALRSRPDAAVLQMANADVTDRTLEYLKDMTQLYSLDVSGTQITDGGLRTVAELPRLRELRLARTKISDEGFKEYLSAKESLLKLDLTGTAVKGKTKRDWKKANPEQRDYVD